MNRSELKHWKFMLDQSQCGLGCGWALPKYDDSCWTDVESYTCWETYDRALADYEGCGWFRTWVDIAKEDTKRYVLKFDGVGGMAQVYINGHLVHTNENRYLPFAVDATADLKNGKNLIAVLVDNSWQMTEHLPGGKRIEWVLYGGLTHHIYLEEQPNLHIAHVRCDAKADGQVKVIATIENRNRVIVPTVNGKVTVSVAGCTDEQPLELASGQNTKLEFCLQAENVKTWSPDAPNLYDLTVQLVSEDTVCDTQTHRVGFRTVEVQGTKILLNGQEILLKGANRYDELGDYGICPPEEAVRADFMQMKACGMNIIRTHYPQDEMHYRLADELGLMYMIEVTLNWWYPAADKTFADFCGLVAKAVDHMDRTFENFCNHPCWTVWSVGNECSHSHPAVNQAFRMLAQRMRDMDCQRLITYAANKPLLDSTELDFVDFLGLNYYHGIKADSVEDFREQMIEPLERVIANARKLYPNKPHVLMEFGSVCVRGLRGSPTEGRFSEDFCAAFLKEKWQVFMRNPQMKGLVIWCWADYRHHRMFLPSKNGIGLQVTYGPFGMVTIDRKPKEHFLSVMSQLYNGWTLE